jgi:hypothetical protein
MSIQADRSLLRRQTVSDTARRTLGGMFSNPQQPGGDVTPFPPPFDRHRAAVAWHPWRQTVGSLAARRIRQEERTRFVRVELVFELLDLPEKQNAARSFVTFAASGTRMVGPSGLEPLTSTVSR